MILFAVIAYLPSPFKKIDTKSSAIQITPVSVPKPVEAPKVEPPPVVQVQPETSAVAAPAVVEQPAPIVAPQPVYPTDHVEIMQQAGINPGDYSAIEYVLSHESGWRWWIANNEGSGATGLCQALPASKMASAGADYLTNPVTQMKWCDGYAKSRYGSWANAMATGIARDTTGSGWGWW